MKMNPSSTQYRISSFHPSVFLVEQEHENGYGLRGLGIALQSRQEKKALSSRGRGRLLGFLELRRPWGFSPEARRGSQGASRAAPGKTGLHARGEGERVLALESLQGKESSSRLGSRT